MLLNLELKNEFLYEEDRLKSFVEWPFKEDCSCTAIKMAEAGFFFSGSAKEPDVAQCFICFKKLDGWEPEDDPWKEHMKHAPQCPFIKRGKKQSDMTYFDFLFLTRERAVNIMKTQTAETKKELGKYSEEVRNNLKVQKKKKKK